jgi:2,4'-dihydroxyacetophenone dioxygenase
VPVGQPRLLDEPAARAPRRRAEPASPSAAGARHVIKGQWRYLEHAWVATEGSYVYEAPGETHTLVVDPHVDEMITMFQVNGAMIYCDPDGVCTGFDDVFTRIDKCRAHYARVGLGEGYVDQFIR